MTKLKMLLLGTLLVATGSFAVAADLPKAPVPYKAPPAVWDWTGFGIGGAVGYDWGTDRSSVSFGATTLTGNTAPDGFAYGGFIYAQKQIGSFVPGVQVSWYGLDDSATAAVGGLPKGTTATKNDKFSSLLLAEAKLGFANAASYVNLSNGWLPYLTGGAACGTSKTVLTGGGGGSIASSKGDNCGWTIGAGVDYAAYATALGKLVLGLKYNYVDLGTMHTSFPLGGGAGFDIPNKQKENAVMFTASFLN